MKKLSVTMGDTHPGTLSAKAESRTGSLEALSLANVETTSRRTADPSTEPGSRADWNDFENIDSASSSRVRTAQFKPVPRIPQECRGRVNFGSHMGNAQRPSAFVTGAASVGRVVQLYPPRWV